MKELTEKQFLEDVAGHQMTIIADNGVCRCIKFAAEGDRSWFNHFTLTTWPWHLAISGDMGTFVFNRLEDMFRFFRTSSEKPELYINTEYWGEKCEAADRRTGGLAAYDPEVFKTRITERFQEHDFTSSSEKRECWEQIKEDVLCAENEFEAHTLAGRFKFEGLTTGSKFEFYDFWEHDLKNYTYQYTWCCYAIAWGIQKYDAGHAA